MAIQQPSMVDHLLLAREGISSNNIFVVCPNTDLMWFVRLFFQSKFRISGSGCLRFEAFLFCGICFNILQRLMWFPADSPDLKAGSFEKPRKAKLICVALRRELGGTEIETLTQCKSTGKDMIIIFIFYLNLLCSEISFYVLYMKICKNQK